MCDLFVEHRYFKFQDDIQNLLPMQYTVYMSVSCLLNTSKQFNYIFVFLFRVACIL